MKITERRLRSIIRNVINEDKSDFWRTEKGGITLNVDEYKKYVKDWCLKNKSNLSFEKFKKDIGAKDFEGSLETQEQSKVKNAFDAEVKKHSSKKESIAERRLRSIIKSMIK